MDVTYAKGARVLSLAQRLVDGSTSMCGWSVPGCGRESALWVSWAHPSTPGCSRSASTS
ncbi:MAG: hypothetical protein AB1758_30980 [Candidatus Eremiobacterota bacterium]